MSEICNIKFMQRAPDTVTHNATLNQMKKVKYSKIFRTKDFVSNKCKQ